MNKYIFHSLISIFFFFVISCSNSQNTSDKPATDDPLLIKSIDKELQSIYKPNEPGASVIAIRDGKTIFRRAYGLANVELQVPMKPDMVFKLGSMTKQFTAIAIMILQERGDLSLNNLITTYFPDYPVNEEVITIKHLLSHTSGIKNYNGIQEWKEKIRDKISPKEIIDIFKNEPLEFTPGDKWKYCNSGYTLLAKIIEKASGQTYKSFITNNIFKPAGMDHTYFGTDDQIIPDLVSGYRKEDGLILKAEYMSMSHPYGGGDILSNTDDLAKWMDALENNKLISKESLEKCFQPTILNNGTKTNYGYGWFIGDFQGKKNLYHGGGVYGFVSHGMYLPEEKIYVAVLHNCVDPYTGTPTHAVGDLITGILLGLHEQTGERIAIQLSEEQLNKYQGVYKFVESPGKRKISVENNKVYYERPPRKKENPWSKTEIFPESKYVFFAQGRKSTITFHFNDKDDVTGFTVNQPFGRTVTTTKMELSK